MDLNKGTSLQDRIKALNLNKTLQLTPEKKPVFTAQKSFSKETKKPGNASGRLLQKPTTYSMRNAQKETSSNEEMQTVPSSNEGEVNPDEDIPLYSTVLNNASAQYEPDLEDSVDASPYSDIPSNIPATFMEDVEGQTKISPMKRNSVLDQENTSDASDETDFYASPISIPVDVTKEKPPEPGEIKFKIGNIRRTIKEPRMRQMVDMSDFMTKSESNLPDSSSQKELFTYGIDFNEVVKSPTLFQRSHSLGDAIEVTDEPLYKRPSLPVLNEQADNLRFTYNADTPITRESSFKSTHSTESGRSSYISEASVDERRSRNFSDVSVTHEADNYVSFKLLYDDPNSDLLPNERTLVTVKGDKAFTRKLTLTTEPSQSLATATSPTTPSTDENSPTGTPGVRTPKKKPRNVFGKISKAMKEKRSSPKLDSSGRLGSTIVSPKRQVQYSPKVTNRTETFSTTLSSPIPTEPIRPKLMSTDSSPSDEGIYYDPSVDNSDTGFGDILAIEVINEEDDEGIYNDGDLCQDFSSLTPEKRSQSLANLNHNFMEQTAQSRRLSDNIGAWRQTSTSFDSDGLYMTSSTPPIPPPKHISMRRKTERKMAESDTVTLPNNGTSSNGIGVKLRHRSPYSNNEDRQKWPNRRPPSMPLDMPPSPPPATVADSANDSPVSDDSTRNENVYVAATLNSSSSRSPNSFVLRKGKPPPIPEKDINVTSEARTKPNKLKQDAPTISSDEDEEIIYHTVMDLDIKPDHVHANEFPTKALQPLTAKDSKAQYSESRTEKSSLGDKQSKYDKPPPILPKKPISKPKPPELLKQTKTPHNYTHVNPKTKAKPDLPSKSKISSNLETELEQTKTENQSVLDISQNPTLNKLPPLNASREKTFLPTNHESSNKETKKGKAISPSPSSPDVKDSNTVKPPPRPLRNKKLQGIAENNVKTSNEQPLLPKTPSKSAAIAELGKLISMGGPMSPQHLKSPQHKTNPADIRFLPPKLENESNHNEVGINKKRDEMKILQSAVTGSATSKNTSIIVTTPPSKTVSNTQEFQQVSEIKQATIKPKQKRPETKRPTTAPPPRPTVRPPPRPDQVSPTEKRKTSDAARPAIKTGPPRRPPPPSSDKIKAAEQRRKLQSITAQEEDGDAEYHDVMLKHEEDNTYADIDDEAFDHVRARSTQNDTTPTPPTRAKHNMKRAMNTMSAIAAMKRNFGRKKSSDNILSEKANVASYGVYNDDEEEEAVYAGID